MLFQQCQEKGIRALGPFLRLLQFENIAGQDTDFRIDIQLFIHQCIAYLRLGSVLITDSFIIVRHGDNVIRTSRIDFVRFLIIFQCFDRIILFQVKITQNYLIAGFHRELVGKLFHLFERIFGLLQHVIQLIFLH